VPTEAFAVGRVSMITKMNLRGSCGQTLAAATVGILDDAAPGTARAALHSASLTAGSFAKFRKCSAAGHVAAADRAVLSRRGPNEGSPTPSTIYRGPLRLCSIPAEMGIAGGKHHSRGFHIRTLVQIVLADHPARLR
jgi:hypothetical protein